jgi:hypothetical protein
MSAGLSESYTPQWLYLREFMDALGSTDESEMQDAVLLLIRDRLVYDGKIDEKHFRFLAGKPSIVDASWLANLSDSEVKWEDSTILAPREPGSFPDAQWFLIEIATSSLSLFGSRTSKNAPRARRTPPEVTRAEGALRKLYGDKIPGSDEMTGPDLLNALNEFQKTQPNKREFKKDSVMRASGRAGSKRK